MVISGGEVPSRETRHCDQHLGCERSGCTELTASHELPQKLDLDILSLIVNSYGLAPSDVAALRLSSCSLLCAVNTTVSSLAPSPLCGASQLQILPQKFKFLTSLDLSSFDQKMFSSNLLYAPACTAMSGTVALLAQLPALCELTLSEGFSRDMGRKAWAAAVCAAAFKKEADSRHAAGAGAGTTAPAAGAAEPADAAADSQAAAATAALQLNSCPAVVAVAAPGTPAVTPPTPVPCGSAPARHSTPAPSAGTASCGGGGGRGDPGSSLVHRLAAGLAAAGGACTPDSPVCTSASAPINVLLGGRGAAGGEVPGEAAEAAAEGACGAGAAAAAGSSATDAVREGGRASPETLDPPRPREQAALHDALVWRQLSTPHLHKHDEQRGGSSSSSSPTTPPISRFAPPSSAPGSSSSGSLAATSCQQQQQQEISEDSQLPLPHPAQAAATAEDVVPRRPPGPTPPPASSSSSSTSFSTSSPAVHAAQHSELAYFHAAAADPTATSSIVLWLPDWLPHLPRLRRLAIRPARSRRGGSGGSGGPLLQGGRLLTSRMWMRRSALHHITRLSLSGTFLGALPAELTSGLPGLQFLAASRCHLSSLPPHMEGLGALTHLDLSHNNLRLLPPQLSSLTALHHLDASHNMIADVSPSLPLGCTALRTLLLNNNQLRPWTAYPPARGRGGDDGDDDDDGEEGGPVHRQQVVQGGLPVHALAGLQSLSWLSLSHNWMGASSSSSAAAAGGASGVSPPLPGIRAGTGSLVAEGQAAGAAAGGWLERLLAGPVAGSLQRLDLANVAQRSGTLVLPAAACLALTALQRLDMSGNLAGVVLELPGGLQQQQEEQLGTLPGAAPPVLPALQELNISECELDALPPAIAGMRQLRVVDASLNRLVRLPPWLSGLPRLEKLSVAGSRGLQVGQEQRDALGRVLRGLEQDEELQVAGQQGT